MLSRAEDRTRHTNCYKTVNYIKQKPRDAPNKPMEFQINFDVKSREDKPRIKTDIAPLINELS